MTIDHDGPMGTALSIAEGMVEISAGLHIIPDLCKMIVGEATRVDSDEWPADFTMPTS